MKLIGIAAAFAVILVGSPTVALEGVPECAMGPVDPVVVQLLHDRLSVPTESHAKPVHDTFYAELACLFTDLGIRAPELDGLSADEILAKAIDQQDLTRTRADALLAILKAMRQAREELALPVQVK